MVTRTLLPNTLAQSPVPLPRRRYVKPIKSMSVPFLAQELHLIVTLALALLCALEHVKFAMNAPSTRHNRNLGPPSQMEGLMCESVGERCNTACFHQMQVHMLFRPLKPGSFVAQPSASTSSELSLQFRDHPYSHTRNNIHCLPIAQKTLRVLIRIGPDITSV